MKTENKIHIYADVATLSEAAARLMIGIINQAILQQGRCSIALSGGHTPQSVYALLATSPFRDEIAWDKTFFFWSDERCVPANDPLSNAYQAKELLLNQISIPEANIFPIDCTLIPHHAASAYEESLRRFFGEWQPRFDLILLGLGANGHTASLFPDNKRVLNEIRLVVNVYVPAPAPAPNRITMTPHLINQATHIMFLVAGPDKAAIVQQVLSDTAQAEEIPALAIQPSDGTLYWLIDKEAASLLPKQYAYEH